MREHVNPLDHKLYQIPYGSQAGVRGGIFSSRSGKYFVKLGWHNLQCITEQTDNLEVAVEWHAHLLDTQDIATQALHQSCYENAVLKFSELAQREGYILRYQFEGLLQGVRW